MWNEKNVLRFINFAIFVYFTGFQSISQNVHYYVLYFVSYKCSRITQPNRINCYRRFFFIYSIQRDILSHILKFHHSDSPKILFRRFTPSKQVLSTYSIRIQFYKKKHWSKLFFIEFPTVLFLYIFLHEARKGR